MNNYQNIFYNINSLPQKEKIELLNDAKELSYRWHVDILDCKVSFYRKKIDMSFSSILSLCNKNRSHFVFAHRVTPRENYLEIGFSTLRDPSYFLWIYVNQYYKKELLNKYNLKELD